MITVEFVTINGDTGIVLEDASGNVTSTVTISVARDRITDVFVVNDPDKLRRLTAS